MHKLSDNTRNIMLLCVLVVLGISVIGFSYGAYRSTIVGTKDYIVKMGDLSIDFSSTGSNKIDMRNTYPVSDETGFNTEPFKFSITNTGDYYITYRIRLITDYVDEYLDDNENPVNHELLDRTKIRYTFNKIEARSLPALQTEPISSANIYDDVIFEGGLSPNDSKKLALRLWIDENENNGIKTKGLQGSLQITYTIEKFSPNIRLFVNKANVYDNGQVIEKRTDKLPEIVYSGLELNGNKNVIIRYRESYVKSDFNCYGYNTDDLSYTDVTNSIVNPTQGYQYVQIGFTNLENNVTCQLNYSNKFSDVIKNQYVNRDRETYPDVTGVDLFEQTGPTRVTSIQPYDTIEYRYTKYDSNGYNNWVQFNRPNERWRIIGAFQINDYDEGTAEDSQWRVKLIKADPLEYSAEYDNLFYWNNNISVSNPNNWNNSSLKEALNKYYYMSSTGTISGVTYDFTNTGLTETSRSLIDNAKWFLSGAGYSSGSTGVTAGRPFNVWKEERNNILVVLDGVTNNNDATLAPNNSTSSVFKVGLMNLSDYGYASGATCVSETDGGFLTYYNEEDLNGDYGVGPFIQCVGRANQNWLYPQANSYDEWLLNASTYPDESDSSFKSVYYRSEYGNVLISSVNETQLRIRPVVYLDEDVIFVSGDGSSENPYQIGLE